MYENGMGVPRSTLLAQQWKNAAKSRVGSLHPSLTDALPTETAQTEIKTGWWSRLRAKIKS